MPLLFEIGFLPIRFWDILDILIFGYLIYQIYKLLRGSIAFNIFIGVIMLFVVWWLVRTLKMDLLSLLLNQFVSVGVIMLLIIFQPEVRRFLLLLGDTTLRQRSQFLGRMLDRESSEDSTLKQQSIQEMKSAIIRMSQRKWGALIVLSNNLNLEAVLSTGVKLDAVVSQQLIESIFNKQGPLHDGAVVIANNKVLAAGCILPVSDNQDLPKSAGLRHRAAVGITERMMVATFVVSEETGLISFAYDGKLQRRLSEEQVLNLLNQYYR
jgi:diadenylate cyclase